MEIEERGVKLRLTVVDTPGYGDAINCRDWYATWGHSPRSARGYLKAFTFTVFRVMVGFEVAVCNKAVEQFKVH